MRSKLFRYIIISIVGIFFIGCVKQNTKISNVSIPINIKKYITVDAEKNTIFKKELKKEILEKSSTIAIVFPSKIIGKYAIDSTNTAITYMIYKNKNFKIEVFDSLIENEDSIKKIFDKIAQKGITKIIALFTYKGITNLTKVKNIISYDIYLPLIHKDIKNLNLSNVVYGSIDYSKQIDELLKYSNNKVSNLYASSDIGNKLAQIVSKKDIKNLYQQEVNNDSYNYNKFISTRNKKIKNSTILLNMPIVKSSIILSQINAKDIRIKNILSSQLNYSPLLLSLTQVGDRKNMIVANSIISNDNTLNEYNALMNNEILYSWVNYSTIVGVEYLINKNINKFKLLKLDNQQVIYPIELYKTTKYSFTPFN